MFPDLQRVTLSSFFFFFYVAATALTLTVRVGHNRVDSKKPKCINEGVVGLSRPEISPGFSKLVTSCALLYIPPRKSELVRSSWASAS